MLDYDIIGAIKIKDGLFLGDEYAAQDLEFIVTNKVTRVINCASKQIPNHWEAVEVEYLNFDWLETESQIIFDTKDEVVNKTFNLIEETLEAAESILVHSIRGQNRSVCVIAAYMMKKYRWTLYKTLEYLHSRRQDLEIKASFFNQLLALENKLTRQGHGAKSFNWKQLSGDPTIENEEILLTNTFLNAKIGQMENQEEGEDEEDKNQANQKVQQLECENIINKNNIQDKNASDKGFELNKTQEIEDFDVDQFERESDADQDAKKHLKQTENIAVKVQEEGTQEKEIGKKQGESKVRNAPKKLIWIDSKGNSLISIETGGLKKNNQLFQNNKEFTFKSIIKGSKNVFEFKAKNDEQTSKEKQDASLVMNTSTNGNGLRKINSLKTSLRIKKTEEALIEKKIIMNKISNSQKELPPCTQPPIQGNIGENSFPKSQSLTSIQDDNRIQKSLNYLANQQLKEVLQAKENEASNDMFESSKLKYTEEIKLNDQASTNGGGGLNNKRRKMVSRREVSQNNAEEEQLQNRGKFAFGNTFQNDQGYDDIDQGFGFVRPGSMNSGSVFGGSAGITPNNNFAMTLSAKNFFTNQNMYPLSSNQAANSLLTVNSINPAIINPPKFSIKNSFKSTQRIYQNTFKPALSQPNFLQGQGRNSFKQDIGPELGFQIQRLGNKLYSEEKKLSRAMKVYSRPSTAPNKQNPFQKVLGNSKALQNSNQMPLPPSQSQNQQNQQQLSIVQPQLLLQNQQPQKSMASSQSTTNNGIVRQASFARNGVEENSKKSIRSNSAGNQNYPTRYNQFGLYQPSKTLNRWKF